ncbi:hypothetical protein ACFVAM_25365, partial [Streptomyces californicus]|uniref:hypothetical protein n=1 Tax=Streptomyces californicus TaxID=67351 RepID=UPI00369B6852
VEDEFLVYRGEWEDHPGMVVAIDPQTMTQRTVMTLDEDATLEHDMWWVTGYGVRLVWDTHTRTLVMARCSADYASAPASRRSSWRSGPR